MRPTAFFAALGTAAALAATSGVAACSNYTIVFGRTGGNIDPSSVTIRSDGSVTAQGALQRTVKTSAVQPAALTRIRTLIAKERFFSLPALIRCRGALPDFAASYITVTTGARTKTVSERGGGCSSRFDTLYKALAIAVGTRG